MVHTEHRHRGVVPHPHKWKKKGWKKKGWKKKGKKKEKKRVAMRHERGVHIMRNPTSSTIFSRHMPRKILLEILEWVLLLFPSAMVLGLEYSQGDIQIGLTETASPGETEEETAKAGLLEEAGLHAQIHFWGTDTIGVSNSPIAFYTGDVSTMSPVTKGETFRPRERQDRTRPKGGVLVYGTMKHFVDKLRAYAAPTDDNIVNYCLIPVETALDVVRKMCH